MKIFQFGEQVDGYEIPVLNEREIRAAAGILFLLMFVAINYVVFNGEFLLLKYAITVFLLDMLIRVLINPKFSPFLILGRFFVRKQVPLYVGAPQKRFAWVIGITISFALFYFLVLKNFFVDVMGLACFICLVFLFFETAFGICIGCKIYALFNLGKVQHCPGEICHPTDRQPIQQISKIQLIVLLTVMVFLALMVFLFGGYYELSPGSLI